MELTTVVDGTSRMNELECVTLRTKFSPHIAEIEGQIRQNFSPLHLSYIPSNFTSSTEGVGVAAGKAVDYATKQVELVTLQDFHGAGIAGTIISEAEGQDENKLKQWFNDGSKAVVITGLAWEKLDVDMERQKVQYLESGIVEARKLSHRSEIGDGETLDEPYSFTQTPPLESHCMRPKSPGCSVKQIKRQTAQMTAEASSSSDIRKKLKKGKKRSKIGTLPRESESSDASEDELRQRNDSFSFNQKKAGKTKVTDELPSGEAKLGERNVHVLPTSHPASTGDSLPHTTFKLLEDKIIESEAVATTVDHQGNINKKKIKTQQVIRTVQHQTHETFSGSTQSRDPAVNVSDATMKSFTSNDNEGATSFQRPNVEALDDKLTPEARKGVDEINGNNYSDVPGELVSSHTVTQGNRTIETITYKTEKDGTVETRVEHRVTIHSCDDIDHDAELSQAILEATNMNPDMTVEKIEVKHESQS
ncbi:unnamed protein product [Litomosoides sigmodontis]|uniref:Band 4.1 C-terminal domain-containing protein n=1 Tax=Litomosoides sigmodontis TaxID=42156 RepID=A0A3P6TYV0_LITSI|nr:unnamed protein product [Litomosoides sigmodontis]